MVFVVLSSENKNQQHKTNLKPQNSCKTNEMLSTDPMLFGVYAPVIKFIGFVSNCTTAARPADEKHMCSCLNPVLCCLVLWDLTW